VHGVVNSLLVDTAGGSRIASIASGALPLGFSAFAQLLFEKRTICLSEAFDLLKNGIDLGAHDGGRGETI
jgi:hypothetical protein